MNRRNALKNTGLLLGVTVSTSTMSMLFKSCQGQRRLEWQPQFFSSDQASTVSAITEIILPKTDTPGALDLKVDMFVDLMCKKALSSEDQQHILKGYDHFVKTTQDMFETDFPSLPAEEQAQVVEKVAGETNKFNLSIWGSTIGTQPPIDFLRRIKQFTLLGYYSSDEIGKNVLSYDPIPGEFKGCIPVDEVGNAWTL